MFHSLNVRMHAYQIFKGNVQTKNYISMHKCVHNQNKTMQLCTIACIYTYHNQLVVRIGQMA